MLPLKKRSGHLSNKYYGTTMKSYAHVLGPLVVLVFALGFIGCGHKEESGAAVSRDTLGVQHKETASDYYTCPMHPSVRSDKPGACPVCGMALVKKSVQAEISADTAGLRGVSLSPAQRIVANVSTVAAVRRSLSTEINAVGVVAAPEPSQATVAARFRGRLEKLHVNSTGQKVRKGEPLFEMYSPDLISAERDLLLALQSEKLAGREAADGSDSMQQKLLDASRDRLVIHFGLTGEQLAQIESSGQIRNTVTFVSPISGTVLQKEVQEGMYVDEGMTLYQLADLSTVWAYLDVYEKDLLAIKLNQPIAVTTEAYPGRTFSGRVTFIDPVVNPGTRTVRVRTEFPNREGLLKPNMFIRARLSSPAVSGVVVPQSAVLSTGPRTVVWVEVAPNQFEPRDVELGMTEGGQVEVLRGVREGEMVAQTGGFLIDSESALQQPGPVDPHAGHNTGTDHAQAGVNSSASPAPAESRATIVVDGQYVPEVVHVRRDTPLTLDFVRKDGGACTSEVVFMDLNLRHALPEGKTTTIELPPQKPGEIHFSCGMGMLHGTIIVE
jgi:membrane fusion protein, copper/silver efflux system